jgi:hypothetical protein
MTKLLLLGLSSLLLAEQVNAEDSIQVNGVVSAGYIATSDNNFIDKGGDGAFLTENLLRIVGEISPSIAWSGQIVYREAGDNYDDGVRIDFLQLDYTTNFFDTGEQRFTLGRYKNRQGLYNETRDVPFARPSILLPQSVYLDNTRNFLLNSDGLKLSSFHPFESGDFTLELAFGKSSFDDKFTDVTLTENADGDWESEHNYYFDLRWESQAWTVGFNYTDATVEFEPDAGAMIPFDTGFGIISIPLVNGAFDTEFTTVSIQHSRKEWEFTFEQIERKFETTGFLGTTGSASSSLDGYYLQARYFLTEEITLLARYDESNYKKLASADKGISEAEDKTFGISWNFLPDWQLNIEYHEVHGYAWLPPISKLTVPANSKKDWSITAVQISTRF